MSDAETGLLPPYLEHGENRGCPFEALNRARDCVDSLFGQDCPTDAFHRGFFPLAAPSRKGLVGPTSEFMPQVVAAVGTHHDPPKILRVHVGVDGERRR